MVNKCLRRNICHIRITYVKIHEFGHLLTQNFKIVIIDAAIDFKVGHSGHIGNAKFSQYRGDA